MMRKLAFIFLLVVLGAIGYLGYSIFTELQEKQAVKERIAELPVFSTVSLEGQTVQSKNMVGSRPLILTYFSTGCEFCKAEIRSMKKHEFLLQESNIWLVSDEPETIVKEFAATFELDSLQSIQALIDEDKGVKKLFGVKGVPNTFVYGKDGKLLKSFKGEVRAEVLYQLIK